MNRDKKPGMETVKIGGIVYEVSKKPDLQGKSGEWGHIEYKTGKIVLDYTQKEKETAQWLSELLGSHVEMIPRVNYPKDVPTPDYLVDGVKFDLKEISGSGKNVVDNTTKKLRCELKTLFLTLLIHYYPRKKSLDYLTKFINLFDVD